ncbi:hypothetical protein M0805_005341 [Coniferiporia weirii]|nr:hypothetical protein M0805_005341 [Coniferiporia weirii]
MSYFDAYSKIELLVFAARTDAAIEVNFKGNRPQYPISVKLRMADELRKSPRFGRDEMVQWDMVNYAHLSVSTDFTIVVQEVHKFNRKKDFAAFTVVSADIIEKESVILTGRVLVNLTCVPALPTDDFADLLFKEAAGQLGTKKVLFESLGRAGQVVATFMKFADIAAEMHPAAKATVAVVNILYEGIKQQQECHQAAADLLRDVSSFLPFAKDITHELMKNGTTRQIITGMLDLFCQISNTVVKYSSRDLLGDMLSSDRGEIEYLKTEFGRLKESFDWRVKMEIWRTVIETEKHAEDIQLRQLRPARQAYYDEEKICLEGTRVSVLEQVNQWADSGSKIFWMHGVAGSGKSSIANSVAHMFRQQQRLPGCFFCKRDDPECRDPKRLVPTLAYHFSKWHKTYRALVLSLIQGEDEPKLTQSVQWQFQLLFKQPLETLSGSSAEIPPTPLIIVIDALDECGDSPESRSQLAGFLMKLAGAVPWLKVFVTSRPLPEFKEVFLQDELKCRTLNINTQIDQERVQDDLLRYTRHCADIFRVQVTEEQIKAFALKASGLFIWISTVFRFIGTKLDKSRAVSSVLSPTSAGNQEAELDQIYTTVVKSASADPEDSQIVKVVLGVIASTARNRALPEDALVRLLSSAGHDVGLEVLKETIDHLQAVLYRDGSKDDAIRVCHPSFLDFINSQSRSKKYWTEPAPLESILAVRCLEIMVSELKFNICELESSFIPNADVTDMQDRIHRCIPQYLQYSCLYWLNHLMCSDLNINEQSAQDLLQSILCHPKALFWLECLSLIRELKSGIDILADCSRLIETPNQIVAVCKELYKLVSAYYTAIATSTPHLYISALSWVPSESLLAEQLYPYFSGQPFVSSGKEKKWRTTLWIANTEGRVLCNVYSPNGRHIVSASDDGNLYIWDSQTGNAVGEPLKGHTDWVRCVAYSPTGKHIASGSDDNSILIWDAESGTPVRGPISAHTDWIRCIAFSPDGKHIVSGADDNVLCIWDVQTGELVGKPLEGDLDRILTVAYSPDGKHIVAGSHNSNILIWDAETHDIDGELVGHSNWIHCVTYSPDGKYIVSGSADEVIIIWDAETKEAVGDPLKSHTGSILSVAYSPDGKQIASGSDDKTLQIWDAETREVVGEPLRGHSDWACYVAYSPDGRHIASGSYDNTLHVWDAQAAGAAGKPLKGQSSWIQTATHSPDGKHIISGSSDGTIQIWDAQTGETVGEPLKKSSNVFCISYSPDGKYIVCGQYDTNLQIWDVEAREMVGEPLKGHEYAVRCCAYSPDGKYIVSGSDDNNLLIWDAETREVVGEPITGHIGQIQAVAYSPDGKYIVSGSADRNAYIWDVEAQTVIGESLLFQIDRIRSVAYSPDGNYIATGSDDKTICIWNVETREIVGEALKGHTGSILGLAYSLDGKHIVSASSDKTLCIWDAESGKAVGPPLTGHSGNVNAVAYSPDGKDIVSASDDGSLRIWAADIGQTVPEDLNSERSLSSDGWFKDPASGGLLLWVPYEYRDSVCDKCKLCIPLNVDDNRIQIDWENLLKYCGTSWNEIHDDE